MGNKCPSGEKEVCHPVNMGVTVVEACECVTDTTTEHFSSEHHTRKGKKKFNWNWLIFVVIFVMLGMWYTS